MTPDPRPPTVKLQFFRWLHPTKEPVQTTMDSAGVVDREQLRMRHLELKHHGYKLSQTWQQEIAA